MKQTAKGCQGVTALRSIQGEITAHLLEMVLDGTKEVTGHRKGEMER